MDRLAGVYRNRLEDDPNDFRRNRIPASQAPVGEDRAQLEARRDELRASLQATPGPEVYRSLTLLLSGCREFGRLAPKDATMRLGLYAEALRTMPTWAIERARQIFGKGGWRCLWDGRDSPSSADVAVECRHILLPIEAELRRLDAVLDAEPYDIGATDDDRAGAVAYATAAMAEMSRESAITERTDDEISVERSEQQRSNDRFEERDRRRAAAEGREPETWGRIPISDELAQQLRRMAPARAPVA